MDKRVVFPGVTRARVLKAPPAAALAALGIGIGVLPTHSIYAQSSSHQPLDRAAVQEMENGFAADFNRGEAMAIANRYTENAYVLPLNGEMVQGHRAIENFFAKAVQTRTDLHMTALDVQPLGSDAAMVIGTVALKIRAQPSQQEDRKYLKVYQRVGDDWKMSAFIWNGNKAP